MRRYPGGGAFALFFHPHPREFATQNKKSANARGLARGGGDGRSWNWLMCVWLPMARIDEWDPVADSLRTNERESFNYRQLSFTFGPALQKNKNFKLKKITILLVI